MLYWRCAVFPMNIKHSQEKNIYSNQKDMKLTVLSSDLSSCLVWSCPWDPVLGERKKKEA